MAELPTLEFASQADFEAWLAEHVDTPGVWIKFAKKASGIPSVNYRQALDVALRHGWIDGQVKSIDEAHYLQRFTPRTRRSRWSKINRARAEELIAAGEMTPAGLREVEAAKADGRWDAAYSSPANSVVPPDLLAALATKPEAAEFFEKLNSRNRYAILYQIEEAKRPETRARRIEKFVGMLDRGETLH